MKSKRVFLVILIMSFIYGLGCSGSGGGTPIVPDAVSGESMDASPGSHSNWGMWQFVCDPEAGTVDVVKLRDADMHLNALKFLE